MLLPAWRGGDGFVVEGGGVVGEGWVPGVREGGGVERGGEVEAQKREEKGTFHGGGDIHLDF